MKNPRSGGKGEFEIDVELEEDAIDPAPIMYIYDQDSGKMIASFNLDEVIDFLKHRVPDYFK